MHTVCTTLAGSAQRRCSMLGCGFFLFRVFLEDFLQVRLQGTKTKDTQDFRVRQYWGVSKQARYFRQGMSKADFCGPFTKCTCSTINDNRALQAIALWQNSESWQSWVGRQGIQLTPWASDKPTEREASPKVDNMMPHETSYFSLVCFGAMSLAFQQFESPQSILYYKISDQYHTPTTHNNFPNELFCTYGAGVCCGFACQSTA